MFSVTVCQVTEALLRIKDYRLSNLLEVDTSQRLPRVKEIKQNYDLLMG